MKTRLCAGVLSLVIACSFSAQAAGGHNLAAKVENQSSKSLVNKNNQLTGKIDLNKADVNDLAHSIKGIGDKRAEAIVKYRQTHGVFKSIAELAYVPGLGSNFVKKNNAELERLFKINWFLELYKNTQKGRKFISVDANLPITEKLTRDSSIFFPRSGKLGAVKISTRNIYSF